MTYYGTPATVAQVKFNASEWYRFPVDLPPMESYRDYVTNEWENRTQLGLAARLYHGCPFGAFLGMLFIGGFIAGHNPCKKRTQSVIGAFCTLDFWEAWSKGQSHMFDFAVWKDSEPQLNICCMPVVIEVVPMEANFVHMHGNKFCMHSVPGNFLPGCAVQAVHINKYVFTIIKPYSEAPLQ